MLPLREVPVHVGNKGRIVSKTECLIKRDRNLRTRSRDGSGRIRVPELANNSELVTLRIGVFVLTPQVRSTKYSEQCKGGSSANQSAPPHPGQRLEQSRNFGKHGLIHDKAFRLRIQARQPSLDHSDLMAGGLLVKVIAAPRETCMPNGKQEIEPVPVPSQMGTREPLRFPRTELRG